MNNDLDSLIDDLLPEKVEPSDLDSIIDSIGTNEFTQDRMQWQKNQQREAGRYRKAVDVARENRTTVDVAYKNLEALEGQKAAASFDEVGEAYPAVAKVGASPESGPLSRLEIRDMGAIERLYRDFGQKTAQSFPTNERHVRQWKRVLGTATQEDLDLIEKSFIDERNASDFKVSGLPAWMSETIGGTIGTLVNPTLKAGPTALAFGLAGAVAGGAAGALAGGPLGAVAGASSGFIPGVRVGQAFGMIIGEGGIIPSIGGAAYESVLGHLDENGIPLPEETAKGVAIMVGASSGLLEAGAIGVILKSSGLDKKLYAAGTQLFIDAAVKNSAARGALAKIGRMGAGAAAEGSQEMIEEVTTLVGSIMQGGVTDLQGQKLVDQIAPQAMGAFAGGALMGGVFQGAGSTVNALANLAAGIKNSKATDEQVQAIAQQLENEGDNPGISVEAAKLNALFQAEGISEEDVAAQFPELVDQLNDVAQGGADILLSYPVLARLSKLESFGDLLGDIRRSDNSSTENELKARKKELEEFFENTEIEDLEKTTEYEIKQEMLRQQVGTPGFDPAVADRNATIATAMLVNLAQRNNQELGDFWDRYKLTIEGGEFAGEGMAQGDTSVEPFYSAALKAAEGLKQEREAAQNDTAPNKKPTKTADKIYGKFKSADPFERADELQIALAEAFPGKIHQVYKSKSAGGHSAYIKTDWGDVRISDHMANAAKRPGQFGDVTFNDDIDAIVKSIKLALFKAKIEGAKNRAINPIWKEYRNKLERIEREIGRLINDEIVRVEGSVTHGGAGTLSKARKAAKERLRAQGKRHSIKYESKLLEKKYQAMSDEAEKKALASFYNRGTFDPSDPRILSQKGKMDSTVVRGFFEPDLLKITLTGQANLTTFLHETGHYGLAIAQDLIDRGVADSKLINDMQALRGWVGLKDGETWEARHHEKFARGFEQYLFEGKAPSNALRSTFRRVTEWFKTIYKRLDVLGVPLTPEVRSVFDRLLASDQEISEARVKVGFTAPMPRDAVPGLSDQEYTDYVSKHLKNAADEQAMLDAQAMNDARREIKASWHRQRQTVEKEMRDRLEATDGWKIWRALADGDVTLDPETIEPSKRSAATGFLASEKDGGQSADLIAEINGFESGASMLDAIAEAKIKNRDIPGDALAFMRNEHGAMTRENLETAAMETIHEDGRAEILLTELRAITPDLKIRAGLSAEIKENTDYIVSGMTPRQMQAGKWRRAELKAAKESASAKTPEDRALAKRRQLYAFNMHRSILEAQKEERSINRWLKPFITNKRRGQIGKAGRMYVDGIDQLLEGVELKSISGVARDKIDRLGKLMTAMAEMGEQEITLPDNLRETLTKTNYADLTMNEIRGLRDAVKSIWNLSKLKNRLIIKGRAISIDATLTEMEETALSTTGKVSTKEWAGDPDTKTKIKLWFQKWRAERNKAEFLFAFLDSKPAGGIFTSMMYQPLSDAYAHENKLMKELRKNLYEPMNKILKSNPEMMKRWNRRYTFMGLKMDGSAIVSVALNLGNLSNKKKLLEGYGWDESTLRSELDAFMTKADWDVVQLTWDQINTIWPLLRDVVERDTGLPAEKVDPHPIETPFGTYAGGYYPVVYDPRFRSRQAENQDKSQGLFSTSYSRPELPNGMGKARVDYSAPILLSMDVIGRHLTDVVHYVTHYEAITNIDRLMRMPRFKKIIDTHLGPEYYKRLRPWLTDVARNQDTPGITKEEQLSGILKHLRLGSSITALGFNIGTGLMQELGMIAVLDALPAKWVMRGIKEAWLTSRRVDNWRFAFEQSNELEAMVKGFDRDVRAVVQRHRTDPINAAMRGIPRAIIENGFTHIGLIQSTVNVAAWFGAYRQALEEKGMTPEEAVVFGDAVMRQTQGTGAVKDLASLQRGTEASRMISMFYSWFSVLYNRLDNIARTTNIKSPSSVMIAAKRVAIVVFLMSAVEEAVRRGLSAAVDAITGAEPDDDDEAGYLISSLLGGMDQVVGTDPFARMLINFEYMFADGFKPQMSPIVRSLENMISAPVRIGEAVFTDEPLNVKDVNAATRAIGTATQTPIYGIWRTINDFLGGIMFDEEGNLK